MLTVKDLFASVENKEILKGINLKLNPVKFMPLWVLMGPEKVLLQMF